MPERPSARSLVVALLVLSAVGASVSPVAVASSQSGAAPTGLGSDPIRQQGLDTDSVRLVVSASANGTATWTIQYWTQLDDENTTDAFESLRRDVEANPGNFSDRFAARMRSTVATAENATGREMTATDFTVRAETRTPPRYGVLIYTFQWRGFAAVSGDTIRIGDAVEGLFLDDRTRLIVGWPSSYAPSRVAPEPDDRRADAVVWRGAETSFVPGEPRLVLGPSTNGTTVAAGNGSDGSGNTDGTGTNVGADSGGDPPTPLLGAGLLIALCGAVAWYYRGRFGKRGRWSIDGSSSMAEGSSPPSADDEDAPPGATADREDLLSNEERVLRFVRERGGRVKQQEIVEAFDWTEARTSQIVRELRDGDDLEGFRLGRENVLKLPEGDDGDP